MYPQGAYRTDYCENNQEERNGRGSGDFESSRQQGGIRGISPDHNARLNKGAIPREGTPNQKGRTILPKKDKESTETKSNEIVERCKRVIRIISDRTKSAEKGQSLVDLDNIEELIASIRAETIEGIESGQNEKISEGRELTDSRLSLETDDLESIDERNMLKDNGKTCLETQAQMHVESEKATINKLRNKQMISEGYPYVDLERLKHVHGSGAKVMEDVAVTTKGNSRQVEETRVASVSNQTKENEILKSGAVAQQNQPPQVVSRKLKEYRAHDDEVIHRAGLYPHKEKIENEIESGRYIHGNSSSCHVQRPRENLETLVAHEVKELQTPTMQLHQIEKERDPYSARTQQRNEKFVADSPRKIPTIRFVDGNRIVELYEHNNKYYKVEEDKEGIPKFTEVGIEMNEKPSVERKLDNIEEVEESTNIADSDSEYSNTSLRKMNECLMQPSKMEEKLNCKKKVVKELEENVGSHRVGTRQMTDLKTHEAHERVSKSEKEKIKDEKNELVQNWLETQKILRNVEQKDQLDKDQEFVRTSSPILEERKEEIKKQKPSPKVPEKSSSPKEVARDTKKVQSTYDSIEKGKYFFAKIFESNPDLAFEMANAGGFNPKNFEKVEMIDECNQTDIIGEDETVNDVLSKLSSTELGDTSQTISDKVDEIADKKEVNEIRLKKRVELNKTFEAEESEDECYIENIAKPKPQNQKIPTQIRPYIPQNNPISNIPIDSFKNYRDCKPLGDSGSDKDSSRARKMMSDLMPQGMKIQRDQYDYRELGNVDEVADEHLTELYQEQLDLRDRGDEQDRKLEASEKEKVGSDEKELAISPEYEILKQALGVDERIWAQVVQEAALTGQRFQAESIRRLGREVAREVESNMNMEPHLAIMGRIEPQEEETFYKLNKLDDETIENLKSKCTNASREKFETTEEIYRLLMSQIKSLEFFLTSELRKPTSLRTRDARQKLLEEIQDLKKKENKYEATMLELSNEQTHQGPKFKLPEVFGTNDFPSADYMKEVPEFNPRKHKSPRDMLEVINMITPEEQANLSRLGYKNTMYMRSRGDAKEFLSTYKNVPEEECSLEEQVDLFIKAYEEHKTVNDFQRDIENFTRKENESLLQAIVRLKTLIKARHPTKSRIELGLVTDTIIKNRMRKQVDKEVWKCAEIAERRAPEPEKFNFVEELLIQESALGKTNWKPEKQSNASLSAMVAKAPSRPNRAYDRSVSSTRSGSPSPIRTGNRVEKTRSSPVRGREMIKQIKPLVESSQLKPQSNKVLQENKQNSSPNMQNNNGQGQSRNNPQQQGRMRGRSYSQQRPMQPNRGYQNRSRSESVNSGNRNRQFQNDSRRNWDSRRFQNGRNRNNRGDFNRNPRENYGQRNQSPPRRFDQNQSYYLTEEQIRILEEQGQNRFDNSRKNDRSQNNKGYYGNNRNYGNSEKTLHQQFKIDENIVEQRIDLGMICKNHECLYMLKTGKLAKPHLKSACPLKRRKDF